jgi:hypothetical protein
MPADHRELVIAEPGGFLEDVVGHRELSHVVQQAAQGEQPRTALRESELLTRSTPRAWPRGAYVPRLKGPWPPGAPSARALVRPGTPPHARPASPLGHLPVTNALEALDRQLRKALRTKGHFPDKTPPAS